MKILNHKLFLGDQTPAPFVKSPNTGGELRPEYLVIHYTAGSTAIGAVTWLTNPSAKASAHLVIGRDGAITQLVPFNKVAWHAGASQWEGRLGLNEFSIGIELDNAGRMMRHGDRWLAPFGKEYPSEEVLEAHHKNRAGLFGWHIYSEKQLEVAAEVSILLFEKYKLVDVVGHDDISPLRKWDPGPAFPMDSFRSKVLGRVELEPPQYESTAWVLPLRSGPGSQFKPIEGGPLPKGTKLNKIQHEGTWFFVDVLDEVNGFVDLQGWVSTRYVRRIMPTD
jgi:N-acetylmuramoyl-L-alanine amidase